MKYLADGRVPLTNPVFPASIFHNLQRQQARQAVELQT